MKCGDGEPQRVWCHGNEVATLVAFIATYYTDSPISIIKNIYHQTQI